MAPRRNSKDELRVFIPITKIDEEKRLVYGCLAAEELDASGEIMDYATSKPLFEKWSEDQFNASGGLSKGNVRAMHGASAAGKLTELEFDDATLTVEGCAKVVDDGDWNKVLEGVYTGFSIGGKYVKRWKDGDNTRYTARPVEVSLVDSPCIKSATFSVVKLDGSVEDRLFKVKADDKAGDKTGDYGDVDYADPGYQEDKQPRYPIDTEAHIRSAWSYINKDNNASEYSADEVKQIKDKIIAAWKSKIDKDGPPSAKSDNGDTNMFVPTNDAILARATELAKAAGREGEGDWLEFSDQAREALVAENDDEIEKGDKPNPFADGGDKSGDAAPKDETPEEKAAREKKEADAKDATKVDLPADQVETGNLEQVWKAKDGKTFSKKADAIAHNEELAKGEAGPVEEPSLTEQLSAIKAEVSELARGDGEAPVGFDALPVDEQLGKLVEFLNTPDVVAKGLYQVSRTACSMQDLASLYLAVAREAKQEGDGSTVPATLLEAVDKMGAALIAMATEEVGEAMERLREKDADASTPDVPVYCYPDVYVELADKALGLEKADATAFFDKAISISGKDQARLQKIHDHAAALGATCGSADAEGANSDADAEKLAKAAGMAEENAELKKRLDVAETQIAEATPLIKSIQEEVAELRKRAMPPAPRTHVVSKTEDLSGGNGGGPMGGSVEDQVAALVTKYGPDVMATAMIKLSHQQPHHMRAGG